MGLVRAGSRGRAPAIGGSGGGRGRAPAAERAPARGRAAVRVRAENLVFDIADANLVGVGNVIEVNMALGVFLAEGAADLVWNG